MEKVVTHTAVQSLSFHTYSIFLGLKNNNCMSGKSTLFQAKLLWPKWLSGETSGYHKISTCHCHWKASFIPPHCSDYAFLSYVPQNSKIAHARQPLSPGNPWAFEFFEKFPRYVGSLYGQMPHQLALSVKSPTHQHLFKDFPIRQTVYST